MTFGDGGYQVDRRRELPRWPTVARAPDRPSSAVAASQWDALRRRLLPRRGRRDRSRPRPPRYGAPLEAGLLWRRSWPRLKPRGSHGLGRSRRHWPVLPSALSADSIFFSPSMVTRKAHYSSSRRPPCRAGRPFPARRGHPSSLCPRHRRPRSPIDGVRGTAVDLARTVLTVHPPRRASRRPAWPPPSRRRVLCTGRSAAGPGGEAVGQSPDRRAAHRYRGENRLLDEAALSPWISI